MFKPRIHTVTLADDDEQTEFYVREPSGREVLEQAQRQKNAKDRPAIDNARELFQKYLVHGPDDPTPIAKEEIEDILAFRLSAMHKLSDLVSEKIGLADLVAKKQ